MFSLNRKTIPKPDYGDLREFVHQTNPIHALKDEASQTRRCPDYKNGQGSL